MSTVLNIVRRPKAFGGGVVAPVEERVEGLQDKHLVFRFRPPFGAGRPTSAARVGAAVEIKSRISELGTKWVREEAIPLLFIKGIVGIPPEIKRVEGLAVVLAEWLSQPYALGQVGVRNEMTSEGY